MRGMSLERIARACNGTLVLPLPIEQSLTEASIQNKEKTGSIAGSENVKSVCERKVCPETEITSAVLDSRKVTEGALFFATVGERVDGHKFVPSVFEKGACCAVVQKTPKQVEAEQGVPAACWGAYILVEDTLQALKDIAEYYRSLLTIPIVGIIGSVGKTSTKEFIAGVLSEKYQVLKTEGNFNNEIGVPLTLLRIRPEHEAAVVEMGISDFGEMHRLSKMVRPTVCVITNIGQCHLENLKTRDGILKAKTEIFDYMSENGEVCLNGEDDKLSTIESVHGKAVHFFGLGGNPAEEVFADHIENKGLFGSEALLHFTKGAWEAFPIQVTLPGQHMVINAAAAACIGQLLGLSREQIAEGICKVAPVGGRSHLIRLEKYEDCTLIDDCYNANPVSTKAALDLLSMATNRKMAVLGDMFELGEKEETLHKEVGAYAAKLGIDRIVCIGKLSRQMYEEAKKALENTGSAKEALYFATKEEFLKALEEKKQEWLPCHTVLVKASHGMGFARIVELLQEQE